MTLQESPVRDAATAALGRAVRGVDRRGPDTYGLTFADGGTARLRLAPDGYRPPEPSLLRSLADAAAPTPSLLTTVDAGTSPLGAAFYVTRAPDGQRLDDVLALPDAAHERAVREAGEGLAAIHDADLDATTAGGGGPYGDLRVTETEGAALAVVDASVEGRPAPGHDRWPARLDSITDGIVDGLWRGEFADLADTVRRGIDAASPPTRPPPALLHLGYRPAGLTFEPGVTWPAHADRGTVVIRGLRGAGSLTTGDGLLDLALAEDALIGLPLGGTERARALTAALRDAYVAERGVSRPFGERYAAYLLLARGRLLATLGSVHEHTREGDPYETALRCRERVQSLADELR